MNSKVNQKTKVNKQLKEENMLNSQKSFENSKIFNSILKWKFNSHNAMKSLNSEISHKIKDNLSLDIFTNNGCPISSFLSKKKFNGASTEGNISNPINEHTKTIEVYTPHHYLPHPIKEVKNGGINFRENKLNKINLTEEKYINNNTIETNNISKKINSNNITYFSPYLRKNEKRKDKKRNEKKIDEVIINYIDNSYKNIDCKTELNERVRKVNYINNFSEKNNGLKNIKKEEIIKEEKENEKKNINQGIKIYKKKALKINKNIQKNEKNKESSTISNTNISNGKKECEGNTDKEKYISLLNNYRKSIIKQFMFYFKPYYYSFIKKHFNNFILKVKNIKKSNAILKSKKYIKKINRRNINDDGKSIRDLKLVKLNYENPNYTILSYNDTENSYNYINLNNSKNLPSKKDLSNSKKKEKYFLINSNHFNFSSKGSLEKDELYRNNYELLKKYSQIIKRKKRKSILVNIKGREDYTNSELKNENKTIDITSYSKRRKYIINNSLERNPKIYSSPKDLEFANPYITISNGEKNKEDSIKIEKKNYIKIKSNPKIQKEKYNRIKENTLKNRIKSQRVSPGFSRISNGTIDYSQKKNRKRYHLKNSSNKTNKKDNRIIMISKKEKINNINNSHYNKNYISKKIKNIFTIDKKINIHINYVFFIPPKTKAKKNLEKLNKLLKIEHNFSYSYISELNLFNKNKHKNKIYSKKKLTSIKEEEEKSRCSISMIFQNSKTIEEYNTIINYFVGIINDYYIIKMKKSLIYKLKIINLTINMKNIFRSFIFKKIKSTNKNEKKANETNNQNQKTNDLNGIFLVDDKIIMNMNNLMNNTNYENEN